MKQHGHGADEHRVPKTGDGIVPLRDQLSIGNEIWLEMEHNADNPIIPMETCKRRLVSLDVTMDDFEHGCDLFRSCKNQSDQCLRNRDQKKGSE